MKKGDHYEWNGLLVTVRRVSSSGYWADILVQGQGTEWTKRQTLIRGEFPTSAWVKKP